MTFGSELKPNEFGAINGHVEKQLDLCHALAKLLGEKAAAEKEYGRRVTELARGFRDQLGSAYASANDGQSIDALALTEAEVAGNEPLGLMAAANEWLQQLEDEGRMHTQMGSKTASDVADELQKTVGLLSDARTQGLDFHRKLLSERDKIYETKDKARTQYEARSKALVASLQKQERATSEKDQEKFRQKSERDTGLRNQAKNEYILQVAVSNEVKRAINHTLTPRVMDAMQGVNERRVAAARRLLLLLMEMQETAVAERAQGTRRAAHVLARVRPDVDSAQFVRRRIDSGMSAWDEPPDFRVVVDYAGGEDDSMALDGESQAILRNMCLHAQREASRAELEARAKIQVVEQARQTLGADAPLSVAGDERELQKAAEAERDAAMSELEAVQFQAVRAAVEQRLGPVDQGSPHEFKSHTVAISKTCDYCGESIGGFGRKAAKCALCEYTCHAKCQLKVEPSCTGADSEAKGGFLSMFGSKRGRRASKSLHRRSMSAVSGDSATSSSFDSAAQQHQLLQARMSMLPMPASAAGIDPAAAVPTMLRTPQGTALSTVRTDRSDSFGSGSRSSISNSNNISSSSAYGGGIAAANGGAWQRAPIPLTAPTAAAAATAAAPKPGEDSDLVPVLYDFEGDGSRTLTVSAGDRVRVVEADSEGSGWIEISVPRNGQQGLVPASYVDMDAYRKPSPPSLPSLPPRRQQPAATPATALPVLPTSPPSRADNHSTSANDGHPAEEYVVALYDFTARDENELSCKVGNRIRVVSREIGEGWIQGALGSSEGRLPSTYVEDEH
ncbi:Protein BZZ1 [Coemansia sp. RSA 487]|nr:Protein BZZ1 [Coemansia sp. RSA 986]KAJ2209962.1 Protein BZZ1 [Coemansia sp. RSA 487]